MGWIRRLFKSGEKVEVSKEYVCKFLEVDIFKEGEEYTFEMEGCKKIGHYDLNILKQIILRRSLNMGKYESFFEKEELFGCYEIRKEKSWFNEVNKVMYFQDLTIADIVNGSIYFHPYVEDDVKTKVLIDIFKHMLNKKYKEEIEFKNKVEKAKEILNCG